MYQPLLKKTALSLVVAAAMGAGAPTASADSVSLTQRPVVMRLSADEFRIAFGINAATCAASGCSGAIRYRVDWKTEDGVMHSEIKRVDYIAEPRAKRTITVDRARFDTAEGAHTTDVVDVRVERITCLAGMPTAL